jgi:hypothetical protein
LGGVPVKTKVFIEQLNPVYTESVETTPYKDPEKFNFDTTETRVFSW